MPSITCREFIEFLIDYVDEKLPEERRRTFDSHLSICPDCVAYLDSYKKTVQIEKLTFSDEEDLPADLPEELVQAILKSKGR